MILGSLWRLLFLLKKVQMKNEKYYADILANTITGIREVKTEDDTFVDIVTHDLVVEVKFIKKWYEAVGQALHAAEKLDKKPAVYFILQSDEDKKFVQRALETCKSVGIQVFFVEDIEEVKSIDVQGQN